MVRIGVVALLATSGCSLVVANALSNDPLRGIGGSRGEGGEPPESGGSQGVGGAEQRGSGGDPFGGGSGGQTTGGQSSGGGTGSVCPGVPSCDANARCVAEGDEHHCECNRGYQGDGEECLDVDECALGYSDCDYWATCTNRPGTYECHCVPPLVGSGQSCACPQKSLGNVLAEAGFDEASSTGAQGAGVWAGGENVAWVADEDVDGCVKSGSLRLSVGPNQSTGGVATLCAPVNSGTTYWFGYSYKRAAGASLTCLLVSYQGADCQGASVVAGDLSTGAPLPSGDQAWGHASTTYEPDQGTASVLLQCQAEASMAATDGLGVLLDQVYLNAETNAF
jgi:hypothetical protein